MKTLRRSAWITPVVIGLAGVLVPAGAGSRDLPVNIATGTIERRAAEEPAPLWRVPLGTALIESMQFLGSDRIFLGLKDDSGKMPNLDYLLMDPDSGEIIWRYERRDEEGTYYPLLTFTDFLLIGCDHGKKSSVLAIDLETGTEIWSEEFKGKNVRFEPVFGASGLLATCPQKESVKVRVLDLATGQTKWEQTFPLEDGAEAFAPIPAGNGIYCFYQGVECLASATGEEVFHRGDIGFGSIAPPQISGDTLYVVAEEQGLLSLSASTGEIYWAQSLPTGCRITNTCVQGDRIYLRGTASSEESILVALERADGRQLWSYLDDELSLSNLVRHGPGIYFGTPSSLVALDWESGIEVFAVEVTNTGRAYPVKIRAMGDLVVYIGELVVAGYDALDGSARYWHGLSPVSQEGHLNGLDASIAQLGGIHEDQMAEVKKGGLASSLAGLYGGEALRYQNLTSSHFAQAGRHMSDARHARTVGNDLDYGHSVSMAEWEVSQARRAQQTAKIQAAGALCMSVLDFYGRYRDWVFGKSIQTTIERQQLFRRSILTCYAQSENADYVYRPCLDHRDIGDSFIAVAAIHLPTGRRADTGLSPQYLSYGIWNLLDFERGVVYHHGVGLDPSTYEFGDARRLYPYPFKVKTVGANLIAVPIELP